MKSFIKIFLFLILFICSLNCHISDNFKGNAIQGKLDISHLNLNQNIVIFLNGEWEFYWNQLIEPDNFSTIQEDIKYVNLPSNWNNYKINGNELGGDGFATYRLKVKIPPGSKDLWIRSFEQATAYKIYVNGDLILQSGIVGKSKETSKPHTTSTYGNIKKLTEELDIVMQISNFSHRKGGVWHQIRIGEKNAILGDVNRRLGTDLFLAGNLFMLGTYFLLTFIIRKSEIPSLLFSAFCLILLVRIVAVQEKIILIIFPDLWYNFYVRMDYVSIFLSLPIGFQYVVSFFPSQISAKIVKIFYVFTAPVVLFCLIAPVKLFTHTVYLFYIYFAIVVVVGFYHIVRAVIHKKENSISFLLGFLFFISTVINDILFTAQLVRTGYFTGFGILVFMIYLSYGLAYRLFKVINKIEDLSHNLVRVNQSFRKFVPNEFIELLNKKNILDIKLGDHSQKEMCILFSDIRSFTSLAEKLSAKECFEFLNDYLGRMGPIIRKNKGFIDKFIGDAIMALFESGVDNALRAAIEMQKAIFKLNMERLVDGLVPIRAGIGIHKGDMVLGIIGENERVDGTVIADAVNLGARIEALTKVYNSNILISSDAFFDLEDPLDYNFRFLDTVKIKGKEEKVTVVEILDGKDEEELKLYLLSKPSFEEGLSRFNQGELNLALEMFEDVLRINPHDLASKLYVDRCKEKLIK